MTTGNPPKHSIRYSFAWLLTACWLMLGGTLLAQQGPATLPEFQFSNTQKDGAIFTRDDLDPGRATVVILFSPTCDHCQQQAQWINEGAGQLRNVQFVWVSFHDNAEEIRRFEEKYLAEVREPMYFLQDTHFEFDSYFGESNVPTIFVFNSQGKLAQEFRKEAPLREMLPYIK